MRNLNPTARARKPRSKRAYRPITPEGFKGCCEYLTLALRGKTPDPALLIKGVEGSSIERAEVRLDPDDGSPMIAFAVEDRSCRLVDPEAFLYLRLLAADAGHFWLDPDGKGRDYLKLDLPRLWRKTKRTLSMTVLRLISDGGPDLEGEQINRRTDQPEAPHSHYDLRRRNLRALKVELPSWPEEDEHGRLKGKKRQKIKTGRVDAERAATQLYREGRGKAKRPFNRATFKQALRDAASLIDKLPFGEGR